MFVIAVVVVVVVEVAVVVAVVEVAVVVVVTSDGSSRSTEDQGYRVVRPRLLGGKTNWLWDAYARTNFLALTRQQILQRKEKLVIMLLESISSSGGGGSCYMICVNLSTYYYLT